MIRCFQFIVSLPLRLSRAAGVEWMRLIPHSNLNLTEPKDLKTFFQLRNYFLRWELPVNFARAGPG